jgi:UDP:flavonoid glycosyltransferase YjiC (YdhE family)
LRIAVLTLGSRGDVQPFVALGTGLAARGHEVTIAGHARFEADVLQRGLRFHALPGDPGEIFAHPAWQDFKPMTWRPRAHARLLHDVLAPLRERTLEDYAGAIESADAVLLTLTTLPGHQVAADRGVPCVGLHLGPPHRTSAFGHQTLFPRLHAGGFANLVSHDIGDHLLGGPLREPLRPAVRTARGLPRNPYGRRRGDHAAWPPFPVVLGFSEALVPRPGDWPRHFHVTGSWVLEPLPGETLGDDLKAFLAAGPPPVHIGFGSLGAIGGMAGVVETLVGAFRAAGERVIIGPGWAEPATDLAADDVLVRNAPHTLLLPRVKAVTHHGGVGTTMAAMAAGRPSLVVPSIYDQTFWGLRIAAAGAGPKPLPAHRLTPARLRAAIDVLRRGDVVAAAARIGERMRGERGVERGAALVEQLLEAQLR